MDEAMPTKIKDRKMGIRQQKKMKCNSLFPKLTSGHPARDMIFLAYRIWSWVSITVTTQIHTVLNQKAAFPSKNQNPRFNNFPNPTNFETQRNQGYKTTSTRRLVPGSESHCSNSFSTKSGLDLIAKGETSASCNNSASKDATSQEISIFIKTRPWLSHELHRYQPAAPIT